MTINAQSDKLIKTNQEIALVGFYTLVVKP